MQQQVLFARFIARIFLLIVSRNYFKWAMSAFAIFVFASFTTGPVQAFSAFPFVETDIGSPGAAGTYSGAGPPTYQLDGAGNGIVSTSPTNVNNTGDSFSFISVPTSGNSVEITAKLTSLAPIPPNVTYSNYATAGLMMRTSNTANSAHVYVSVSTQNGVNFTTRSSQGATSTTSLGPSSTAPMWLRLVISGSTVAGYMSSDGISWTFVGSTNAMTIPTTYQLGLAVSSDLNSTLIRSQFTNVSILTNVPQRSSSMIMWLRGDNGLQYSGSAVTGWVDQSPNKMNYSQTGTNQPGFVSSDSNANGLPSVSFNGSTQYLKQTLAGMNVGSGASIFIMANPSSLVSAKRFCEFASGTNSELLLYENSTKPGYFVDKAGTSQSLTGTNALSTNIYQLIEVTQDNAGNTALFTNGVANGTGTVLNWATTGQTSNLLGASIQGISSAYCYAGNIAEILAYQGAVTTAQRQSIEQYFLNKYNLITAAAPTPPTISPKGFTPVTTVTISGVAGAQIWFTTDGQTPVVGHTDTQLYSTPFSIPVGTSTTVQAIATLPFAPASSVATSTIISDPMIIGVPMNGLAGWFRGDFTVTSGSNVTQWTDLSGNNNTATQSNSSLQPTLVSNAINGLPALNFVSASSNFLSVPNSFDFYTGATVFAVVKPNTLTSSSTGTAFSSYYAQDQTLSVLNNSNPLYALKFASTGSATLQANNVFPISVPQLIEYNMGGQNGSTGSIYQNGILLAQNTSMYLGNNPGITTAIGYDVGLPGNYYNGQIAELIMYADVYGNGNLSTIKRQLVEAYLIRRYGLTSNVAPTFSIPTGTTLQLPTQVAITASPNATIYYSTNGPATTSSPLYSGPITVSYSQTIYALAVAPSGLQSSASAAYTLNSSNWPAPPSSDTNAPQFNLQIPTPAQ